MPAVVSSPITAVLDRVGRVNLQHAGDLRDYFAAVTDPRDARGVRQWALRTLGARWDPHRARYVAPSEPTLRRALSEVDGDALDTVVHSWITSRHGLGHGLPAGELAAVAIDGKALRGTFARTGGGGVHLLAGISHTTGIVTGCQQLVPVGTSEIAWVKPLLDPVELTGAVLTADALHTTRAAARYLTSRGGHYQHKPTLPESLPGRVGHVYGEGSRQR